MITKKKYQSNALNYNNFRGFKIFKELRKSGYNLIPQAPGVYVVINKDKGHPKFLISGTGGRFRGLNPDVSIKELKNNWVKGAKIIYIGQSIDLRYRLKKYSQFGQGRSVAKRGGRYIWQIQGNEDLILAWKQCLNPCGMEKALLGKFYLKYNKLPFANLKC